jgi:hypothetical protein
MGRKVILVSPAPAGGVQAQFDTGAGMTMTGFGKTEDEALADLFATLAKLDMPHRREDYEILHRGMS